MIRVETFKESDWYEITDPVEIMSDDTVAKMGGDFFEAIKNGVAVTVREDGKVLSCGGVAFHDDIGMLWIKVSKEATEKPMLLVECIGDSFKIIRESIGDMEIVAHVRKGFRKGQRMAKFFDFKRTDKYESTDELDVYVWKDK